MLSKGRKRNEKRLRFETLEGRAMLAGNVVASVVGHTLMLHGDGDVDGNAIVITSTHSKSYTITSDPTNPIPTTINGLSTFSASKIKAIQIVMGDGPDSVTINGRLRDLKNFSADMGAGADTLIFNTRAPEKNVTINMGDGDDVVTFNDRSPEKDTNINMGAGSDTLTFNGRAPKKRTILDGGTIAVDSGDVNTLVLAGADHHESRHEKVTIVNFQNITTSPITTTLKKLTPLKKQPAMAKPPTQPITSVGAASFFAALRGR